MASTSQETLSLHWLNTQCSGKFEISTTRWFLCFSRVRLPMQCDTCISTWSVQSQRQVPPRSEAYALSFIIMMTSSNGNIYRVTGLCAGNSPVTGEFPSQRAVTRSFNVFCEAGNLRRRRAHYDVSVILWRHTSVKASQNHLTTNTLCYRLFETFRFKFHWSLFLSFPLTISQRWFR